MNESEILAAARLVTQAFGGGPRGHDIPGGGGKFTRLTCSRGDLFISYVSRDDIGETVTVEWRGSTVFERDGSRNPDRTAPDGEWTVALASAQADACRAMESAAQKAESDGRRAGGNRGSKPRGAMGLSADDGRQRSGEDPSGPRTGGVVEGRRP